MFTGAGGTAGNIVGTSKFCEDVLHFQDDAPSATMGSIPVIGEFYYYSQSKTLEASYTDTISIVNAKVKTNF